MEQSKKTKLIIAILLNSLIIPGAGHIYVGSRIKGITLALATAFFVIAPVVKFFLILSFAQGSFQSPARNAVEALVVASHSMWPQIGGAMILAFVALAILWIFGIVDVYFLVKRQKP